MIAAVIRVILVRVRSPFIQKKVSSEKINSNIHGFNVNTVQSDKVKTKHVVTVLLKK
jgi:hypothetical protein